MDSHHPTPVDPESSNDPARAMYWASLVLPLAVAMIFATAGLICLWLDVLI